MTDSIDGELTLNIMVFGLTPAERSMVETVVRLSQRRTPRLRLVERGSANVDVMLVDARDLKALRELQAADPHRRKPVLFVDSQPKKPGHQGVMRPVQWSLLPMLLARTIESARQGQAAAVSAEPLSEVAVAANEVLVVDDSLAVRNFMDATLRPLNVRVSFAENGEQALALVQRHAYLCIFLDVVMPGIDGYQVCRTIKNTKRGSQQPGVVMLTSRNSPFDKIRGKMAGCDAYLTKPVDEDELLRLLGRFVPDSMTQAALAAAN